MPVRIEFSAPKPELEEGEQANMAPAESGFAGAAPASPVLTALYINYTRELKGYTFWKDKTT